MCRAIGKGDRRCPGCTGSKRALVDRRRYHAGLAALATSARADPPPSPVPTRADVEALVEAARASRTAHDPDTLEGARAITAAHARLGAAIAARGEEISGVRADEVEEHWRSRVEEMQAEFAPMDQARNARENEALRILVAVEQARNAADDAERDHGRDSAQAQAARDSADAAYREWDTLSGEDFDDEDRYQEVRMALEETLPGEDYETQGGLEWLTRGYQAALSEVRACGGTFATTADTEPEAAQLFTDAAQVYPTEWLDKSGPVKATLAYTRAHYSPGEVKKKTVPEPPTTVPAEVWQYRRHDPTNVLISEQADPDGTATVTYQQYAIDERPADEGKPKGRGWEGPFPGRGGSVRYRRKATTTVTVVESPEIISNSGYGGRVTAIHEIAHRMEHLIPAISRVERAFLLARTTDGDANQEELSQIYTARADERGRRDSFVDHYVGKEYEDPRFREVLSVGVESVFGSARGGLIGVGNHAADRHHRDVVLGILASC